MLFGQTLSRSALMKRVGDLSQVAGIRMMSLRDGHEDGVRIADVRSGSGLRFQVTLDRGMDVSCAEFRGTPLAWRSPNGDVHPSFYDARGLEWSRSFAGGLMAGCGISHLGAPCEDDGEELGLHGRLSNIPASGVSTDTRWEGDQCLFLLRGTMRESVPGRTNLTLHRTYEVTLGSSSVRLTDVVTNDGTQRSPLMILYHFNPGWPLLDHGTRLMLNAQSTAPRDAQAEPGLSDARRFTGPIEGYKEQVFYHDLRADPDGRAHALLVNDGLGIGFTLSFDRKELHRYCEWKMTGDGMYVLGMEPGNCRVWGRAKERAAGDLQFIGPGEQRVFRVEFGVLAGTTELQSFINAHNLS
jgi:Domain of unknown function (DUF4432)